MLSPSFRKQFVQSVEAEAKTQEVIEILDVVLVLVQKFGKQLAQSPIREFAQEHYSDAFVLYEFLGGVRLESQDVRDVQSALYDALGEKVLRIDISQKASAKRLATKDMVLTESSHKENPSLRVKSASKLYKRSLSSDVNKMLQA